MTTPEVIRLAHLMVMMSTTHLSVSLLDGVSLGKSSLMGTKLQHHCYPLFPTLFLANLYIFFSVLLPPA